MNDIIGYKGGGKGGGGQVRTPVEAPDSLRSRSIAKLLDLISEGEIEGLVDGLKSIYLDNIPIQNTDGSYNFSSVGLDFRNGTQSQSYIPGFPFVENEFAVNLEVKFNAPIIRNISNVNVSAVKIRISLPQLTNQNITNGDLSGSTVDYAIDVQPNGGSYTQIINPSITGKTTSKYEREHRINLSGTGPWNIRVRRISPDSSTVSIQNKTFWSAYTEVIDAKLRYPNSALVALTIDSSKFNNIPTRGYHVKLLRVKVPVNYDPLTRVYTGIWNGSFKIAWTDNPAWCFYDLLTNTRYGLGDYLSVSQVDKWALYTIAQYCDGSVPDGFGGYEPRFTCNMYLQTRAEAFNVLQNMASIFRGMLFWQQGAISTVQDSPSDPVYIYNNTNVIDGIFTYSGSSRKARHTVALVTWNDPSDQYRSRVEYVEDNEGVKKYGFVQTEIIAFGCTSRGQANRIGKWTLYSERLETDIVEFKAGLEAVLCRPGQIIQIADENKMGTRVGGRLAAVTSPTLVTLDAPITMVAGTTYYMSLITPTGLVEERTCVTIAGNQTLITVSSFSFTPLVNTIWVIRSSVLTPETFRVLSVGESENMIYNITAVAHEPTKFAAIELDIKLQPNNTSILSAVPGIVTVCNITESLYIAQGDVRTMLTISWEAPSQASKYLVEYRRTNAGNWIGLPQTSSNSIDVQDVVNGPYEVRIRCLNSVGSIGTYSNTFTYNVLGKTAPPNDVTGFIYELQQFGIKLSWDKNIDLDIDSYEIRYGGTNWANATFLERRYTTSYLWEIRTNATYKVWIKAIDTTGNYSINSTNLNVVISVPPQSSLSAVISGPNIVLNWTPVTGSFQIDHYEIRYGTTFSAGTLLAIPKSNTYTFKVDFGGTRKFWLAAVDVADNVGTPISVDVSISVPTVTAPSAEVIDNNVLLRWVDSTTSLPIQHYSVRKGATYGTSADIGIIYSRFATVFEQASGLYTYWVTAIDTAGNSSTPVSITASVNQPSDYILKYNFDTLFSGTRTNCEKDGTTLIAPVPIKTWQQHFVDNSWTTPNDQINAGYPLYFQPSVTSGNYDETIDYGSTIAQNTMIKVTPVSEIVSGSVSVSCDIFVKLNIGDPWIQYTNQYVVFANNFRYVRYRLNFTATGTNNLIRFSSINLRLSIKSLNDNGASFANSTDSGGTIVNFTVGKFLYVESIEVTPAAVVSGQPRIGLYDFVSVVNPTSFKVLLYDLSGNRVSGAFSWSAKGV